jgi:hypothetical protein
MAMKSIGQLGMHVRHTAIVIVIAAVLRNQKEESHCRHSA